MIFSLIIGWLLIGFLGLYNAIATTGSATGNEDNKKDWWKDFTVTDIKYMILFILLGPAGLILVIWVNITEWREFEWHYVPLLSTVKDMWGTWRHNHPTKEEWVLRKFEE
jgi:hypothetical protein